MRTYLATGLICLCLIATPGFPVLAQQNTWTMNGNLSDSATNDASNPDLVFDISAYGGTAGFGSPNYSRTDPDTNNLIAILLNTSIRLHEDDATGRLQRLRVDTSVFGTAPSYRPDWALAFWFNRLNHETYDWLAYAGNLDGASGGGAEFEIIGNLDGTIQARCWSAVTNELDITSQPVSSQEWHHVVFVFANNNTGILYVDGQIVGVDTGMDPDPAFNTRGTLFFGGIRRPDAATTYTRQLDGYLDHIQVFSNVLSGPEVLNLYNQGRTQPQITSIRADEFDMRLTFEPFPGASYRLQYAAAVAGPWIDMLTPVNGLVADSQLMSVINLPTQHFYRLSTTTNQAPSGMVWIEGGDVELGQAGIAEPVHTNYISSFWMDATEVSKAKWDEVYTWAITNGYAFDNVGTGKSNNHPVVNVNWYDCVKWCNARSQKEGLALCYYMDPILFTPYKAGQANMSNSWVNWSANGYRLPTESEWEKAARGGWQGRLFPWGGDSIQHARANYCATNTYSYDTSPTLGYHPGTSAVLPRTLRVGSLEPNGYGLYDMAGNVFEWVWDWYGDYSATSQADSRGPETNQYGVLRLVRGGSCFNFANVARSAYRYSITPVWFYHDLGLRCVRNP